MPLREYVKKRNFKSTPEPIRSKRGQKKNQSAHNMFVVQEHHASHLHYDFRLEFNGVLKSWAVPKGPSLDPKIKRLAVEVEDHPVAYGEFEGSIPKGHYGGGEVYIWDKGTWQPDKAVREGLKVGRLEFTLKGERLKGQWVLIRTGGVSGKKSQWLLIKRHDEFAKTGNIAKEIGTAVKKKTLKKVWQSDHVENLKTTKQIKKKNKTLLGFITPQLAQLVDEPPESSEWIHETKYDGYRTQAHIQNGEIKLFTRSGLDWVKKYPSIVKGLTDFPAQNVILDGEIVWLDDKGRSDFQKLQNALKDKDSRRMVYYVFDLLFLDGVDLRDLPQIERKKMLKGLLKEHGHRVVRFSEHLEGRAKDFLQAACDHELEGIISKNKTATYIEGRGEMWRKSKCKSHQEFVIGGFTQGEGARSSDFGALLLGVYENGQLRYVGRTGTGFTQKSLTDIRRQLKKWEQKTSPFEINSPKAKNLHWIRPGLVAEVTFANWTQEKILRNAVFHGLREDKPAKAIKIEQAEPEISSPDKILFQKEKITKLQVAQYYQNFSQWILPYIVDRPLNLQRCPQGTSKKCFFQKHVTGKIPEGLEPVPITEKSGKKIYLTLNSARGLLALSQMGAFEIHAWGCHRDKIESPDQIIMDFDPGPGVTWKSVVQGCFHLKEILDGLKLKSFVKVSGGKGVHVHIPVKAIYSWTQIKDFSKVLGQEMVNRFPDLYTVSISKKDRHKKIFVDYLRNGRGATAVTAYSLRAREKSAVAMPISWQELKKIKSSDQFDLKTASAYLKRRKTDPWRDYFKNPQKISILKA